MGFANPSSIELCAHSSPQMRRTVCTLCSSHFPGLYPHHVADDGPHFLVGILHRVDYSRKHGNAAPPSYCGCVPVLACRGLRMTGRKTRFSGGSNFGEGSFLMLGARGGGV